MVEVELVEADALEPVEPEVADELLDDVDESPLVDVLDEPELEDASS